MKVLNFDAFCFLCNTRAVGGCLRQEGLEEKSFGQICSSLFPRPSWSLPRSSEEWAHQLGSRGKAERIQRSRGMRWDMSHFHGLPWSCQLVSQVPGQGHHARDKYSVKVADLFICQEFLHALTLVPCQFCFKTTVLFRWSREVSAQTAPPSLLFYLLKTRLQEMSSQTEVWEDKRLYLKLCSNCI